MDMRLGCPEENFQKAARLIEAAMADAPDVLVLPEMWNTGFFPREDLPALCDRNGEMTKAVLGGLAQKHNVNIVAGSVADVRDGKVYNTCYVFDRTGK
jgi:predicted amidohydrolase